MNQLVLASQSPRRKQLLEEAGFVFTVAYVQISEIPDENLNLQERIRQLAREKAEALVASTKLAKGQDFLILSSDTVVVLHGQTLGKPANRDEGLEFLRRLSGQKHSVLTGICLWELDSGRVAIGLETSYVTFRQLTEVEIEEYVDSGEGRDKAGGYGIQGPAGKFVARVEGPMDNIVGLPVATVENMLRENGWVVGRRKS